MPTFDEILIFNADTSRLLKIEVANPINRKVYIPAYEAAYILNITRQRLQQLIKAKKLEAYKAADNKYYVSYEDVIIRKDNKVKSGRPRKAE